MSERAIVPSKEDGRRRYEHPLLALSRRRALLMQAHDRTVVLALNANQSSQSSLISNTSAMSVEEAIEYNKGWIGRLRDSGVLTKHRLTTTTAQTSKMRNAQPSAVTSYHQEMIDDDPIEEVGDDVPLPVCGTPTTRVVTTHGGITPVTTFHLPFSTSLTTAAAIESSPPLIDETSPNATGNISVIEDEEMLLPATGHSMLRASDGLSIHRHNSASSDDHLSPQQHHHADYLASTLPIFPFSNTAATHMQANKQQHLQSPPPPPPPPPQWTTIIKWHVKCNKYARKHAKYMAKLRAASEMFGLAIDNGARITPIVDSATLPSAPL